MPRCAPFPAFYEREPHANDWSEGEHFYLFYHRDQSILLNAVDMGKGKKNRNQELPLADVKEPEHYPAPAPAPAPALAASAGIL